MSKLDQKYLQEIVDKKLPVTMFLISGVKLQGVISDFDDECILIANNSRDKKGQMEDQIVFKKAISTISG